MKTLTTKDFTKFYQGSFKKRSLGPWLVHYREASLEAKVGLSVSTKVYKRAVKRNKIKRLLRIWLKEAELANLELNIILTKSLILQEKELLTAKKELFQLLKNLA